jgi:hypothetical protein
MVRSLVCVVARLSPSSREYFIHEPAEQKTTPISVKC